MLQNRGFITVASAVGKGTTFELYFPRYAESFAAAGADVPIALTGEHRTGRETILLVEDEPMLLRLTAHVLEVHGYSVLRASSPAAAIRLADGRQDPIDLLLTDVVMPTMNGRDLALALTERNPKMKVLFMSGYSADLVRGQREALRDSQFIGKPFGATELAAKVRAVLDGERASAAVPR